MLNRWLSNDLRRAQKIRRNSILDVSSNLRNGEEMKKKIVLLNESSLNEHHGQASAPLHSTTIYCSRM